MSRKRPIFRFAYAFIILLAVFSLQEGIYFFWRQGFIAADTPSALLKCTQIVLAALCGTLPIAIHPLRPFPLHKRLILTSGLLILIQVVTQIALYATLGVHFDSSLTTWMYLAMLAAASICMPAHRKARAWHIALIFAGYLAIWLLYLSMHTVYRLRFDSPPSNPPPEVVAVAYLASFILLGSVLSALARPDARERRFQRVHAIAAGIMVVWCGSLVARRLPLPLWGRIPSENLIFNVIDLLNRPGLRYFGYEQAILFLGGWHAFYLVSSINIGNKRAKGTETA